MTSRSCWISWRTRGRSTFTTTSSPECRRAACTWAMDAAASASRSKLANTVSAGEPKLRSTSARACSAGKGGTSSWSFVSSWPMSGGQQILPRGQGLAELHEDRAEILQRLRGSATPRGASKRRGPQVAGFRRNEQPRPGRSSSSFAEQLVDTVPDEHPLDRRAGGRGAGSGSRRRSGFSRDRGFTAGVAAEAAPTGRHSRSFRRLRRASARSTSFATRSTSR